MLLYCSGARVLSLVGGIYCHMMSEVVEFSVSACQAAAGCSVPLKEGMRPAPVVAEETEVAETSKDETPAEKAEETAADDSGKVSQEQPVYVCWFCLCCYNAFIFLFCAALNGSMKVFSRRRKIYYI